MNRKAITIVAPALLAFGSVSACTPQQIADAVASQAETRSIAARPSVEASADCNSLAFNVAGYPEGTNVMIGLGSQPPFGFTVGGTEMWGFTVVPGGASGVIRISGYDSVHSFTWSVNIDTAPAPGSQDDRVAEGSVTCP